MADKSISRTRIPFILDLVTLETADQIRQAERSGQLDRLGIHDTPSGLPFPFSLFFPRSRMYSANHGWFLPFRSASHPSYTACHAFMKQKLDTERDLTPYIQKIVDLLQQNASDEALVRPAIEALFGQFTDEKPSDQLLDSANLQVRQPQQLLSPLLFRAKGALDTVYSYVEGVLERLGVFPDVPKDVVPDVAHAILSTRQIGVVPIRAIYNEPDKTVEQIFTELALTDKVMRVAISDGDLGGLLDQPMKKKSTLVMYDIGKVARETGDWEWAFSAGMGRICLANTIWRRFGEGIRQEVLSRRERS